MAKNVLVTGAFGFIGGWLTQQLKKNNYSIIAIDKRHDGLRNYADNIINVRKLINKNNILTILQNEEIDCICHLSALSTVRDALHDPQGIVENNVCATANILNAIESSSYKPKKIIFASSSAAIEPITSYYGMSKRTCEDMLGIFSQVTGIPTMSLRFGNVYGPAQNPKNGTLIAKLIEWAYHIENDLPYEPVKMFGDGKQTRDYVYVMDVVSAIQTCIENDISGIENVSTGYSAQTIDIIEQFIAIAKLFGVEIPDLEHTEANAFDKEDVSLPISRKLSDCGWNPSDEFPYLMGQSLKWRLNTRSDVFEHRFDSEGNILHLNYPSNPQERIRRNCLSESAHSVLPIKPHTRGRDVSILK
jgi:UDP-glucose 4-epimerase